TGWSGGAYGVGSRIKIGYTRAMIKAALSGHLALISTAMHPVFNIAVPHSCPGVPSEILDPRRTWPDPARYDDAATSLAWSAYRIFSGVISGWLSKKGVLTLAGQTKEALMPYRPNPYR
ncbi:MAG: phosphoenolpyruvate carboxykinase (ATP), partial [Candidatus Omnitrophica bacterium]|nr:phosphoenolpyruvate carboxykinase (ATP) [Candidatus Omnitrophota bacterium]